MKTCPSCHRSYSDETMKFCLDDGTSLVREFTSPDNPGATLVLPDSRVIKSAPTVAGPQPTLPYNAGQMRMNPGAFGAPALGAREPARRSPLPWLLGIAIVIGVSAIIITWILTRSSGEASQQPATSTTSSQQSSEKAAQSNSDSIKQPVAATPETAVNSESQSQKANEKAKPGSATITRATPAQSPNDLGEARSKPAFGPLLDNISFQGTNLTYYPRPSPGLCQSDCARNPNCKGFTWIKPGGYNPGDGAMCYLISAISGRASHRCCMSAVKIK
jgi:PAN domain-containing protein